jgi:4-diphosphocytidyl-2-C-methyl-D-erythritol kinase
MTIKENAYAKINLSIDIVSRMDNGYHNMRMIMQSVLLHDDITITCQPGEGIHVGTDLKYLPSDDRNIASRAATVFYEHTRITGYRTDIDVKKHIPVCAGLGGGSTDGAAVLRALNTLFETKQSRRTLELLGERVGSDVPFCVAGGTSLAEGRGEILTDLEPIPDCSVVICKPAFAISTPELFSRISCDKIHLRPDTNGLIDALKKKNLSAVAEIKQRLLDHDALGAVMTGTGSAVFGLFADESAARNAFDDLKRLYQECYLTKTGGRTELE